MISNIIHLNGHLLEESVSIIVQTHSSVTTHYYKEETKVRQGIKYYNLILGLVQIGSTIDIFTFFIIINV